MKLNPANLGIRLSSITALIAAACSLACANAKAEHVTWFSDSPTGLNVQIVGTISEGTEKNFSYESPSGLWKVQFSFGVEYAGPDLAGNEIYQLNAGSGLETYRNTDRFSQPGWKQETELPAFDRQPMVTNRFSEPPGSLWSASTGLHVAPDPGDPGTLDYMVTILANGPALPDPD